MTTSLAPDSCPLLCVYNACVSFEIETPDAPGVDQPAVAPSQAFPQIPSSAQTTSRLAEPLACRSSVRLRAALGLVPVLATLGLLAVLSFRGGGYLFVEAAPWVLGWFAVMLVWVVLARPWHRPSAPLSVALAALGLLTAWGGLSILWSVGPDLSWVAFDYALLYLAFGLLLALAPVTRLGLRAATYGYLIVALFIAVYALLGKVVPEYVTHAHLYARLLAPVGYWNVLAVMLVMAVPAALALAARKAAPSLLRAAAAAATVFLLVTLFFTFSRGGFLTLGVALIVYFAAARERLSSLVSLAAVVLCALPSLYAVRNLHTLFQHTANGALRASQGHELGVWLLIALVAVFVVQFLVALLHRRLFISPAVVRWVGVAVLAVIVCVAVLGPLVYMESRGGVTTWVSRQYHAFINGSPTEQGNSAARLTVISSNGRVDLYRTALREVPKAPLLGTGAGTFAFTNYRYRQTPLVVKHAHSQWFNELSELGYPGLILFFVFAAGLVVAVVRQLIRMRRDPERGLLAAAAAASFAFLFHISGDWDWDMAAITAAFFVLTIAVCCYRGAGPVEAAEAVEAEGETTGAEAADPPAVTAGPEDLAEPSMEAPVVLGARDSAGVERRLPWPATVLLAGVLLLAGVAWTLPWLSERAADQAHTYLFAGDLPAAAAQARRAISLNPLAVDPLITLSLAQQGRGLAGQSAEALNKALAMQPENWWLHYQMGLLQLKLGDADAAISQFRQAYELDPLETRILWQLARLGV